MAEAEEVIADAARHATVFVRDLWRRGAGGRSAAAATQLRDTVHRLDLLVTAVFGRSFPIHGADEPAPTTFLSKVLRRGSPRSTRAIPGTDGARLWLPRELAAAGALGAVERYRVLALQQAMRAHRGGAGLQHGLGDALERSVHHLLEAHAADAQLVRMLPGLRASVQAVRSLALAERPPLESFRKAGRPLEELLRATLGQGLAGDEAVEPRAIVARAKAIAAGWDAAAAGEPLHLDLWTGEWRRPVDVVAQGAEVAAEPAGESVPPRSARLPRSPRVRPPSEEDADRQPGAWMVQTSKPHEQVEDPAGMQRPTDRDTDTAADDYADALSELPEARLVLAPGAPKEVLLSEETAWPRSTIAGGEAQPGARQAIRYPEWDYRAQAYREGAVTVHIVPAREGPQEWVDRTLAEYQTLVGQVQRRFEMLRVERVRLKRQMDGTDVDVAACIDALADARAGLPMPQALYETCRETRRDMSVLLLVDASGSTDGWVSTNKRIVDVEREALLLVSLALRGASERSAIASFSGEGPGGVVVRTLKDFEEAFSPQVARRIASLEPEHYTRTGAALRHATAMLMGQAVRHRLLLLLSDGKPNDLDEYEGRYGVEDLRQAVCEARLQGVNVFCLTVDRQAATYLPAVFGARQYALLPRAEGLPTALLDWMKRLLQA
jgi:nitric oxide reductase NorD protein